MSTYLIINHGPESIFQIFGLFDNQIKMMELIL